MKKIETAVSFVDTEGAWKTDYWFPIQTRKTSANFIPVSQKVKIANFMGLFFLKATLVQPKTVAQVGEN